MKYINGKRPQSGRDRGGRSKVLQSGPHNRLRLAAANKAAKVKWLKDAKRQPNNGTYNNMLAKQNSRVTVNNIVDARVKLMQKALETPTAIIDARQKLTKRKDARKKIQERRLNSSSYNNTRNMGISRGHSNNLDCVKIDRHGILNVKSILDKRTSSHHTSIPDRRPTVNQHRIDDIERRHSRNTYNELNIFKSDGHNLGCVKTDRRGGLTVNSILDERDSSYHISLRDQRPTVNQDCFDGVERRHSRNAFNGLNTFRNDRLIEDISPPRRDMRISRRPITNLHSMRHPSERSTRSSRRNEKPYSRPMAMDLKETNRHSQSLVMSRNVSGNSMFNRDGYEDDLIDRNSRNHGGLSETFRSRSDSHRAVVTKRSRPADHKIVISNLEPSVTSENIRVMSRNVIGNSMFNRDGYEDDLIDRNSRNRGGLSETFRSRLDSHRAVVTKRSRPADHKIVISNLEPSVTSEDIKVMNRNVSGNSMFNRDGYEVDLIDRNSRNHGGLTKSFRSRLDSHRAVVTKRSRPADHKIVISNLEPSVTSEDIRELFADIGNLLESRVVRPGVAEVIYKHRADAIEAVEVYHNRQLDGRPMKCDMVRNAVTSLAGSISLPGSCRRMNSRSTDIYKPSAHVTYDIDAVHTALFNK